MRRRLSVDMVRGYPKPGAFTRYTGNMSESPASARVVRALSSDHHIRMAALDARSLWDGVRRGHPHLGAEACACLTELMAATLLLQSRSLFAERLQLLLRSAGRARAIVTDSWPDGMLRGFLDEAAEHPDAPWLSAPGLLQVMRSGLKGEPYVGKLPLVEGGISTQIEAYLLNSEQVQASLLVWCEATTGEAGGLLVEPLPACPPDRLQRLIDGLEGLAVVPNWERDPDFLIRWINQGEGATRLSSHDIEYRCKCNKEALVSILGSFPKQKIDEIFTGSEPAEVRCDYCGRTFAIRRQEVSEHGPQA